MQTQFSMMQAAKFVLHDRQQTPGSAGVHHASVDDGELPLADSPPFGWMEACTCVAVLFAWRMQVKLARIEAEERDKSAQPPKEFAESFDNIAGVTTVEKSTEAMRNRTGAGETTPP